MRTPMNPGPIDETAKGTVEALKGSPMVLALLVFNLAFIGFLGWITMTERQEWSQIVRLIAERCGVSQ